MNGVHDMGGMHGMGPIEYERNEPVFHARWESRVYALNRALAVWGKWTKDASRHIKEMLPPAEYLRMSYYEKWYVGIVELCVKTRLVTRDEVESGKPVPGSPKAIPPLTAEQVTSWYAQGERRNQYPVVPPRFHAGQRVRARNINPTGHTRLPRYARGKVGTVEHDHGVFHFADTVALFLPDKPQHIYSIRFTAQELWGDQAKPRDSVFVDMWDDYLEEII